MNQAELDTLLHGITEDKVYEAVARLAGPPRRGKGRGALLYQVVEALAAAMSLLTDTAERDLALARVREAAVAVVKQSKRMGYVPNR